MTEGITYTGSNAGLTASGYFNASAPFTGAMAAALVYRGNYLDNGHWSVGGAVTDVLIEGNTMVHTEPWNSFTIRQALFANHSAAGDRTARVYLRDNDGMAMPPAPTQ